MRLNLELLVEFLFGAAGAVQQVIELLCRIQGKLAALGLGTVCRLDVGLNEAGVLFLPLFAPIVTHNDSARTVPGLGLVVIDFSETSQQVSAILRRTLDCFGELRFPGFNTLEKCLVGSKSDQVEAALVLTGLYQSAPIES